jgi:hypothetical protein
MLTVLGVAAKFILDRTARGRADAKAKGVKFGQKKTHAAPAARGR